MTERRTKPRRDEDKLAFYPWYVRDFNADPPVQVMSPMEEFCYRRLLDYQWLNGSVPGDVATLARICKNIPVRQMAKAWEAIKGQFPMGVNRRMENERRDVLANIAAKTAHAKKGADGRWNPPPELDAPDMPEQCPSIPETMPGVCYPEAEANTEVTTTDHTPAREALEVATPESLPAYDALRRICKNPDAFDLELAMIAAGGRAIKPMPTWAGIGLALQHMLLNGDPPKGALLGKYVARAMADLAGVEVAKNGGKPTYTGYLT